MEVETLNQDKTKDLSPEDTKEEEDGNIPVKEKEEDAENHKENNIKQHAETFPRTENRIQREPSVKSKSVVKQGHLRIKEDGQKIYKKTSSQAIMSATQLGIGFSVGRLTAKPERDVLMQDFYFVEKVWFPSDGSRETPSHKFNDFRFKCYAPAAFRYFRDLFGIQPSDFLLSLSNEPLKEIGNPGASGSIFFVSNDDMFIVKTVQHKEATFLQQLLPGYYMNLHQNPRTLLPKFFGLYCYQSGTSNIRLTVMNNLLPTKYKCHLKFDLKGSTYKRKASKAERAKSSPTYKDLDFMEMFPRGITLDHETYDAIIKTISRDLRVLESFSIMDYSFLLGIHNVDEHLRTRGMNSPSRNVHHNPEREARKNEFSAKLEAIQLNKEDEAEPRPVGGIPAKNDKGERIYLFIGIIDILQSYRLAKKMEHGFKSMITDGDTVSVHKPSFYAKRFLDFIKEHVFKRSAVQRQPTKRRSVKTSTTSEVKTERQNTVEEANNRGEITPTMSSKMKKSVKILDPKNDVNIEENTGATNHTTTGTESTSLEASEPEKTSLEPTDQDTEDGTVENDDIANINDIDVTIETTEIVESSSTTDTSETTGEAALTEDQNNENKPNQESEKQDETTAECDDSRL